MRQFMFDCFHLVNLFEIRKNYSSRHTRVVDIQSENLIEPISISADFGRSVIFIHLNEKEGLQSLILASHSVQGRDAFRLKNLLNDTYIHGNTIDTGHRNHYKKEVIDVILNINCNKCGSKIKQMEFIESGITEFIICEKCGEKNRKSKYEMTATNVYGMTDFKTLDFEKAPKEFDPLDIVIRTLKIKSMRENLDFFDYDEIKTSLNKSDEIMQFLERVKCNYANSDVFQGARLLFQRYDTKDHTFYVLLIENMENDGGSRIFLFK